MSRIKHFISHHKVFSGFLCIIVFVIIVLEILYLCSDKYKAYRYLRENGFEHKELKRCTPKELMKSIDDRNDSEKNYDLGKEFEFVNG